MRKWIFIGLVLVLASCSRQQEVVIITGTNPSPILQFAADELSEYLGKIYPETRFVTSARVRHKGANIQLITGTESTESVEGAFSITHSNKEAVIAGFDDFGALQGVYHLLEKLGCHFQLSGDIIPSQKDSFSFEKWVLSDFPLQKERIVFNWHNFLSGCTGWDLEQWQKWILQSAKLGFNTIMIHTYGNNPIHSFEHLGTQKNVGYLATTTSGRDWGTEHVNDIRRLFGGEHFDQAIFGSTAALVEDSLRISAARVLMQDVFSYAEMLGMKINFAFDMDTRSANPQDILSKLPEHAQIKTTDGFSLANPDTEEGLEFYRSQLTALLKDYPQIDKLVGWTRKYNPKPPWLTPIRSLTPAEFPSEWQMEYQELLEQNSSLETDIYGPSTFALGKIMEAYSRIISESGKDVELGSGSWGFEFLPAANGLYPEKISLYPLDFHVQFYEDNVRKELFKTGSQRTLVPIVWAHHDDHRYMGKPYTPFESFQDKLDEAGGSGFGIIHWLTRPLDIYFKSLSRQVWNSTSNEKLSYLNKYATEKIFPGGNVLFEEYINDWILNAPMFGRETSDFFMDPGTFIIGETPSDPDSLMASINYRIGLLEKINSESLDSNAKEDVEYYLGMEYFFRSFIQQQSILFQSNKAFMDGRFTEATELVKSASPEQCIEAFSKLFLQKEPTRGELAMIISLNLRWHPDFINQKQLSRLEPVRLNFQATSHDPLAQAPGLFSFWVDEEGHTWKGLGQAETGSVDVIQLQTPASNTGDQGILSRMPFTVDLQTWRGQDLSAGRYSVILHLGDPLAGTVNLKLGAHELIEYRMVNDSGQPRILFEIDSKGGPLKLSIDPLEKNIVLSSVEINPLL